MDLFRTCFEKDAESDLEKEIKEDLSLDFSQQMVIMRGQDKHGRAVLIKTPRTGGDTTERAWKRAQLYISDRAAAVTEFLSVGKVEKCTAIFSMHNQNSRVSPPLKWQIAAVGFLQKLYPARVELLVILEAHFFIRTLFKAIKPFLGESIRKDTELIAGKSKRESVLGNAIEGGEMIFTDDCVLAEPVDVEKYLNEVPFYMPYGHDDKN